MNSYEHTSRDFLPLSVIRSACAGDTDAVEQVLQHYRGYINKLCTGILYDKHGQPHVCIDEYMKRHAEKVNGVWEQRLRIHYNCVGTIEIPSALPLPTPDVSVNTRKGVVVNYAPCDVAI